MAAPDLADPAVVGRPQPGLTDPRVEAEVADELLRAVKTGDVADRRHQPRRYRQVHAGDGQEPIGADVFEPGLGDRPVQHPEILPEPVELADVPGDRLALVLGHGLARKPFAPRPVEEIGVRALRDQVCMQDRMYLVLEPGPVPHDLIAPRHQPA